MKLLLCLALVAMAVIYPGDTYDSKYDNLNINEVLDNKRLFDSYVQCLFGNGQCTAEGNEIKGWIPEAIPTSCSKCNENQKKLVAKALTETKAKYPADYDALMKKNNPDGKYDAALAEFLSKYSS